MILGEVSVQNKLFEYLTDFWTHIVGKFFFQINLKFFSEQRSHFFTQRLKTCVSIFKNDREDLLLYINILNRKLM